MKGASLDIAPVQILIVEDEAAHVAAITRSLEESATRFEIRIAGSLRDCREAVSESPPDIVLVDLNLPDGRAVELLSAPPELNPFPILIMTSYGNETIAVEAIKSGALDYIVKSQGAFRDLPRTVERALREWRAIQERKRAEKALEEARKDWEAIFRAIPHPTVILDAEQRILAINQSLERRLASLGLEYENRRCWEIFHGPGRNGPPKGCPFSWMSRSAEDQIVEMEVEALGGVFLISCTPIFDSEGRLDRVIHIATEITERKKAEDALRESEKRLRSLYNETPIMLHSIDPDGRLERVNDYWLEVLGYERSEVLGRPWLELLDPESRAYYWREAMPRFLAEGTVKEAPYKVQCKDGHFIDVLLSASAERNEQGALVRSLAAMKDISNLRRAEEERRLAETQLRQAQKMEAIGTLAGGIAHDFNNILGIIIGYTEIARWSLPEGSRVKGQLDEVLKATDRAKELVQQILAFSRQGEQERKPVQISLIAREALKMLRATLPATIDIRWNLKGRATILGDPTHVHQVLMNLCTNAAHAMQDRGGLLEINLTDVSLSPESDMGHPDLQPGPYAMLTVRDTGHGIDPRIVDRIFDPFFTTKEAGVGTGLGLAVVHGIVKSHGGAIDVESELDRGTTFTILLPAVKGEGPSRKREVSLPRGHERVLVVDDEDNLANAMRQMLDSLGYEAVCRTSGVEALEAFRHQDASRPYDLVVTDMTMPAMTGVMLAKELLRIKPELPIILCTGFSQQNIAENAAKLGIRGFLAKPVTLKDLAVLARQVLDDARSIETDMVPS